MQGVIVLLLKDYLKLGLTGALLTFLLFRCRKVLFNNRERSVTCQRYSFRPIEIKWAGIITFSPGTMPDVLHARTQNHVVRGFLYNFMANVHYTFCFYFRKGISRMRPLISFFKWEILEPTCSHQQSIQQRKREEKHQHFLLCSQHSVFNRLLFLADIWKTNLMKFAVIWGKRREKAGFWVR